MGEIGNKSLVSLFDDLCQHQASLLPNFDQEFVKFVGQQEMCRLRWQSAETTLKALQEEHDLVLQEVKQWKTHFENMKKEMLEERQQRMDVEHSLSEVGELFTEVKDMVKRDSRMSKETKLRFATWYKEHVEAMPECAIAERSSEFDKTGLFEFDVSPNVIQNQMQSGPTPNKRARVMQEGSHGRPNNTPFTINLPQVTATYAAPSSSLTTPVLAVPKAPVVLMFSPRGLRRSNSEPEAIFATEADEEIRPAANSVKRMVHFSPSCTFQPVVQEETLLSSYRTDSANTLSSPFHENYTVNKLMNRMHNFVSKIVIRPETCSQCGRRIKFSKQALKCQLCHIACHPQCTTSVNAICVIPVSHSGTHKQLSLSDFTQPDPPRVPSLILSCVGELEKRGMKEVGLYRLSALDKDVKELKKKFFKGKTGPNLSGIDVHIICAVIKDFLRSVGTLIPKLLWQDFADAARKSEPELHSALYSCIAQLPLPYKETLAFLILHWQRIAESPDVKMPTSNLATVLGPTVVGFSSETLDADTMLREQSLQVKLMGSLLHISSEFWNTIYVPQPLFPSVHTLSSGSRKRPLNAEPSHKLARLNSVNCGPSTGRSRFFTSPQLQ